jgi:hypothetical protein
MHGKLEDGDEDLGMLKYRYYEAKHAVMKLYTPTMKLPTDVDTPSTIVRKLPDKLLSNVVKFHNAVIKLSINIDKLVSNVVESSIEITQQCCQVAYRQSEVVYC